MLLSTGCFNKCGDRNDLKWDWSFQLFCLILNILYIFIPSYLILLDRGRGAIAHGTDLHAAVALRVALPEELVHDALGPLPVEIQGLRRVAQVGAVHHVLQDLDVDGFEKTIIICTNVCCVTTFITFSILISFRLNYHCYYWDSLLIFILFIKCLFFNDVINIISSLKVEAFFFQTGNVFF